MDVVIAIGARPGYMKTWGVYQAFLQRGIQPTVVATGQHQEILKQQQDILPMKIHHWLLDEQPRLNLDTLYGVLYQSACSYLSHRQIDVVFVNGDTTSALAVAMAAFHLKIPIAHIESGLRSGSLDSPYPEEFNRIAIDAMSTYLFAPTERAARACQSINPGGKVSVTGNTVIDALKEGLRQIQGWTSSRPIHKYILLDMHRRETDSNGMEKIVEVVLRQAMKNDLKVFWPAHPNPKIQAVARSFVNRGIEVMPPLDYLDFIEMVRDAELVLTDSGGVVEEAITIGTPTLQLRDHTDRQEAIDIQYSWLATTNSIEIERLLKFAIPYAPRWKEWMKEYPQNPYGSGDAGSKSVDFFMKNFKKTNL